jgi:hypothetical protein
MDTGLGQNVEEQIKEAQEYLDKHRIPQLLELLTTSLLYNRPG